MDEDFLILSLLQLCLLMLLQEKNRKKRWLNRRWWVRPINVARPIYGDYEHLVQELKYNDLETFFRYARMKKETFKHLLQMTKPFLTKLSKRAFSPEHRLIITLRYLATGDQILSIALAFRCGESTVRKIIHETCSVIVKVLQPIYLCLPTEEEWKNICTGFLTNWNFPHCVGSFDGKHVEIQAPPHSGSLFFNYKKKFSIVLMAACDHRYRFTLVDIGAYGSSSDGGIFTSSDIHLALQEGTLNLPKGSAKLPGSNINLPCFFLGDSGFPISSIMMRPYSGKLLDERKNIFNYRLSRARRTIENTFGILTSRWRIYRKPINVHPKYIDTIVMATICLHNYIKFEEDVVQIENRIYCPPNFVDSEDVAGNIIPGEWRRHVQNAFRDIPPTSMHHATTVAYKQRDKLADYFLTPQGEVPWQYQYVRRGLHHDDP
ncbi:protein ALP1-like [Odontomachus brunneus]|uniref:protein ALP1-like n=1 Tax=Odontomachus brunneus TaxID=486640 RepID=UPI0013F1E249|nr:protein ALP1-like [Odontomachus brunneus]